MKNKITTVCEKCGGVLTFGDVKFQSKSTIRIERICSNDKCECKPLIVEVAFVKSPRCGKCGNNDSFESRAVCLINFLPKDYIYIFRAKMECVCGLKGEFVLDSESFKK